MTATRPLDRRAPARGDERRAALLRALDVLLQDGELDRVSIEDISRHAGITRSAFYFYFESKAAAVGALVTEMYDDILAATRLLVGDGEPRARIEATIAQVFRAWEQHQGQYRAMLEARQTSSTVRELWDADRESFVEPVAAMIDAERVAGRAAGGPDSRALASVLLEVNDRALERLARGGGLPIEQHRDVIVTIWLRTIYGSAA